MIITPEALIQKRLALRQCQSEVAKPKSSKWQSRDVHHCYFIPPNVHKKIEQAKLDGLKNLNEKRRQAESKAIDLLGKERRELDAQFKKQRLDHQKFLQVMGKPPELPPEHRLVPQDYTQKILVYDAKHSKKLPGYKVHITAKTLQEKPFQKKPEYRVFTAAKTYVTFLAEIYKRRSLDGNDCSITVTVNYSKGYNNAYWGASPHGQELVFGNGDGKSFGDFTVDDDVLFHEGGHAVTQYTCNLEYERQSGAANESFSDVDASIAKQWEAKQTVKEADWLIGKDILKVHGKNTALRNMAHPELAYDPQPATMDGYVELPLSDDDGGVHQWSGPLNRTFNLFSLAIAEKSAAGQNQHSYDAAGPVWYHARKTYVKPTSNFADIGQAVIQSSVDLYGQESIVKTAAYEAFRATKILI